MKKILITGCTGTMGSTLIQMLLKDENNRIYGISRDEQKQREMIKHPRLSTRIGDVRDAASVARMCPHSIDVIYHLAALKCVDTLQHQPDEAVATNILGTQNILDIADSFGARLIFASTDKACYPINVYGQTKAIAENMVLNRGQIVCRYGNVIGSRGSFIQSLTDSLLNEGKAYVTDERMTRFWMSSKQVAEFLIESEHAMKGTLQIPGGIKSSTIIDFVDAVANCLNVNAYETKIIGVRAGEKLHETLCTAEEKELIVSSDTDRQFDLLQLNTFIRNVIKGDQ